jgi:putative DNA primase/helicase
MDIYSEAIESCLRTIAAAQPGVRERVFELQAADAVRHARKVGIEKIEIVDRLDTIIAGWEWDADERQHRLGEAARLYDEDQIPLAAAPSPPETVKLSTSSEEIEDDRPPAFSDEALALGYAKWHVPLLRYVAAWGRWLIYDGQRWKPDDTLAAFDLVRHTCREAAHECDKPRAAASIASAKTAAAVERLAKADRRLAATSDQWDADLWALNTPAGVVDLYTGDLRPHNPLDHITKLTGTSPNGQCSISEWLRFLDRIMGGDAELIAFLKRVAGYALTGSTIEHALFFLYGTGANGKTTFINAVAGCAGDYHKTSPIETFTASGTERHPTDLAGLRGARLVTAVETEEGRRWAESKIKSLTGGDKIAARFMRQDFFEYTPVFKLIIAGNHKPGLRSVDEAIRRRFHLVPFTITIPPADRDAKLAEKLQAEWPGILAWAIEGCLDWQKFGLAPPTAVLAATAAYLEGEDALAAWIDEACEQIADAWENSTILYRSWKSWAERVGE